MDKKLYEAPPYHEMPQDQKFSAPGSGSYDKIGSQAPVDDGGDEMRAKIAVLETKIDRVQQDVRDIRDDVKTFKSSFTTRADSQAGRIRAWAKNEFDRLNGRVDKLSESISAMTLNLGKLKTHAFWFWGALGLLFAGMGICIYLLFNISSRLPVG